MRGPTQTTCVLFSFDRGKPVENAFIQGYKPPPARTLRRPDELVWTVHHDKAVWTCEMKFHGESYGREAIILRGGELMIS